MRLIFIPGLGEDEFIFDHLLPFIPGEKLVLNTWQLFCNHPRGKFTGLDYAREVAARYQVTDKDLVIGHSLGGLTALYLKYLTGCKIIQIASYTHKNRIVVPISSYKIIEGAVRSEIFFNNFIKWLILNIQYYKKPSKPIVNHIFNLLKKGDKINVINQVKVALNPQLPKPIEPDLRIHSKGDKIVRPPKEAYYEVPGDHFSLYTHPDEVAIPINNFIQSINASGN